MMLLLSLINNIIYLSSDERADDPDKLMLVDKFMLKIYKYKTEFRILAF